VPLTTPHIVHRYLPNGMEVYLERSGLASLACLQIWIKTGSVDEEEHEAGLAHFAEHMLFKGTEQFPNPGEVAYEIETAGGEINAFTKFENTVYQTTVPASFTENATALLLDMVSRATFSHDEVERERAVILEEAARLRDHPGSVASLHLFSEVFQGTRLERPIIGHVDVIKNAPPGLIRQFYKKWYVPNNMVFVAAGDFDPESLFAFLKNATSHFTPQSIPTRKSSDSAVCKRKLNPVHIFKGPWQEARVSFGCLAPCLESAEAPAWHMFTSLLGSGDSCRLTRVVHDERQLVATIDAGIFMPRFPAGMFTLSYFGESAKAAEAASASVEEISRLATDGPLPVEINRIVNSMISDRIFGRESVEGLVNNAGFALQTSRKLGFEEDYLKRLQAVSEKDICDVAKSVCSALENSCATFSIAADEHVPSDFNESNFLKEALSPLQKTPFHIGSPHSISSETESEHAYKGLSHITSKTDSSVRQIKIELPGSRLLHINFREVKRLPIVSASFAFMGGTTLEDSKKSGIAHIATELMTHGTTRQSYETFVDELEDKAASISTFSTHDMSGIQMDTLSAHAPRVFDMLTDCVFRPALSGVQWERVKIDSQNAIVAQRDNPMVRIRRNLSPLLFGSHSYARHPLGTEESLGNIEHMDAAVHLHRMLAAPKYVFSIAGDFSLDRFISKLTTEFTHLANVLDANITKEWETRTSAKPPCSPQKSANRFVFENLQREQAHLAFAFRTFPITDKRRLAIELGSTVLGGQGGRLFRDLRDSRSLAYSLGTSHIIQAQAGSFFAFIGTAPEKMEEAFRELRTHLERMANERVSEQELERAKKSILGGRNIDAQYFHYQASQLAMSDLYGLDFDSFLRFDERVNAVTTEDIVSAFSAAFQEGSMVSCIVGPENTWRPDAFE
jgi:zinc protease